MKEVKAYRSMDRGGLGTCVLRTDDALGWSCGRHRDRLGRAGTASHVGQAQPATSRQLSLPMAYKNAKRPKLAVGTLGACKDCRSQMKSLLGEWGPYWSCPGGNSLSLPIYAINMCIFEHRRLILEELFVSSDIVCETYMIMHT